MRDADDSAIVGGWNRLSKDPGSAGHHCADDCALETSVLATSGIAGLMEELHPGQQPSGADPEVAGEGAVCD